MPLTDYAQEPIGFVREVLGGDPWGKQEEILEAVRDHDRVTVRSCHAAGKSWIAACCVLWRLHCFQPAIVLTTAPSHRQVKDVLWRQIRRLQNRAKVPLPGTMLETKIKIAEDTFADGFSTDESDRFQGYHSPHLFIVAEEAAGIPETIFEGIDGCLMTEGGKLLLIGNPTSSSGRFHSSFRQEGWKKIVISAFDSPNVAGCASPLDGSQRPWPPPVRPELVSVRQVERAQTDWGIDTPIYQARILGEFPDMGDDTLFPLSWIELAVERHKAFRSLAGEAGSYHDTTSMNATRSELGVDVARYGGCETVVAVRRGALVTRLEGWMGQDLMATCGRVTAIARAEEEETGGKAWIKVDSIGLGAGVVDRLRECGLRVLGVNVAERALAPERYERRRDEVFFTLRERFRRGEIALPDDDRLAAQLTGLHYRYTSAGKLQVESKDDLRARGLRSPDRADALALAFSPLFDGALGYASAGAQRPGVPRVSA